MSAITLVPIEGEEGKYSAMFHFLNVEYGSGLYLIFQDKLYRMWNEMCESTNGEEGIIASVNKWASENDIPGDDPRYAKRMNSEYSALLETLCNKEEYQFDMKFGNKLKMRCIMDLEMAGEFDVEIVAC